MGAVAPQPAPLLAGMLSNGLLLLRPAPGGGSEPELSLRPLGLAQPLALAWTSLAAAQVLPDGETRT